MRVDLRELLILSTIPGIGPARLISLLSHFQDTHLVLQASAKELIAVQGIEKKTALNIVNFFRDSGIEQSRRFVDDQLSRLNKVEARVVTFWDKEYPSLLKNIYDPPAFLFVRGTVRADDKYSVAIVGTRTASEYGRHMAEKIGQGLAKFGITVVSGLARGIDTIAHASSLKAGGRTLAVVGSGVDIVYPGENRDLAERIVRHGAIVSEYPMGAKPDAPNFPRRNRIISGITLGTVVIETGIEGGAMITASTAFDQNRELFAVPAQVDGKRRSGTNLLIRQGKATLIETVEDIVETLSAQLKGFLKTDAGAQNTPFPPLTAFEQKLYDVLCETPMHIDTLAERAGSTTADALVNLLSLEFKGVVKQNPGKVFVRIA
jgi:DNA processing protein